VTSAIDTLETRLGANWIAIRTARAKTEALVGDLSEEIASKLKVELAGPGDDTFSIVVTGSLGRGEATEGSDADWFLLIDGPSYAEQAKISREVGAIVRGNVRRNVGPTGTFGDIVASHELVHYIAGTRDSNENLTRRILLLSESRALTNPVVRRRVIRNVLTRYVVYDRSVRSSSGNRQAVPRFFLNDVVRYWRTMASDFASKMWDREREGWAIRNVKLRFSRKVLFIWGLLAAFSAELFQPAGLAEIENDDVYLLMLTELIVAQTDIAPLELLARVVLETESDEIADAIFASYDKFLGVLADPNTRKALETVKFEEALDASAYAGLWEASQRFNEGVTSLFFDVHPKLPKLIRDFGVF
jgi:hypothetical protein